MLFLQNRAIDPDFACIEVDNDVVGVRNRLWPSRSLAGALGEYVVPVLLVVDSVLKKLHGGHAPVGFGADQEVQIDLLRTNIAICRGDGDLAKDSLDNRDPLCSIAFTDCNDSVRLLNRQGLDPIFKSNARSAVNFGADKRAYLARASLGISRDAFAEAMFNWRIPKTARSGVFFVAHCTYSPDPVVAELRDRR